MKEHICKEKEIHITSKESEIKKLQNDWWLLDIVNNHAVMIKFCPYCGIELSNKE